MESNPTPLANNGHSNGHNGHSNGHNGHSNGHNGHNGHSNGHNGHSNGRQFTSIVVPQLPQEVEDGWDLRQFLTMVRRRAFVIAGVAVSVLSFATISTLSRTPEYESKFQVLVEPITADNDLAELTTLNPAAASAPFASNMDYQTQIQVLQSPQLLTKTVEQLRPIYPDLNYATLRDRLSIMRVQDAKILEVRYRDSDPQKVEAVTTQLAKDYLRYSLEERQTNLRQGIQFVEEQLPQLRDRVDELQEDLQIFRQQNSFIDPTIQSEQISEQVQALAGKRLEVDQQLTEARSHLGILQGESGAVAALEEAPQYQTLIGQLREVEVKIAEESTRFSDQNPAMEVLRERRQKLFPILRQEAERVLDVRLAEAVANIQSLEVRSQAIAQAERQLQQQVMTLPVLARQYVDYQRELQVATDSLSRFLSTRETLQIEAAQTEIPWQLLSAPMRPEYPVSPNVQRSLVLGAIAGLLLGVGVALLLEKLDEVFHSTDELNDMTKLPMLGTIPYQPQLVDSHDLSPWERLTRSLSGPTSRKKPSHYYGASSFSESFRSLYANIRLLGSDTPIRSLTISSAQPSDGKSTATTNLARAAAAMGQRVLLVDADLRRPQIHEQLGLPNLRGLSSLITGSDVTWQEVVQTVPEAENLYAITAGQIPPDPTKLLSSRKMHDLMAQWGPAFDLVIYDTPPLLGLADANFLATRTNGVILVVGLGKTDRSALKQVLENLKIAPVTILGTIANGLKGHLAGNYGYYQKRYGRYLEQEGHPDTNTVNL